MEKHTCPRRREIGQRWEEGKDTFETRGGDDFRSCSYCGSMHPEDFMEKIRSGVSISGTDKSYKFYVGDYQKFYTPHLSPEQGYTFERLWQENLINWSYPPYVRLYLPGPSDDLRKDKS